MTTKQRNDNLDAANLVRQFANRHLQEAVYNGYTFVQSESNPKEQYRVTIVGNWGGATAVACGCKSGNYRGWCWHMTTTNTLLDLAQETPEP